MRVNVNVSDEFEAEIKEFAKSQKKTLGDLFGEAVAFYITYRRHKDLGRRLLELAGKTTMNPYILNDLEKGRREQ